MKMRKAAVAGDGQGTRGRSVAERRVQRGHADGAKGCGAIRISGNKSAEKGKAAVF